MVLVLAGLAPCKASAVNCLMPRRKTIKTQLVVVHVFLPLCDGHCVKYMAHK